MVNISKIAKQRAIELVQEAREFDGHYHNILDYIRDWLAEDDEMLELGINNDLQKEDLFNHTIKEVEKLLK